MTKPKTKTRSDGKRVAYGVSRTKSEAELKKQREIEGALSFKRYVDGLAPGQYVIEVQDGGVQSVIKMQQRLPCDEKADSQPHFTLLAQDNLTPVLVGDWINLASQHSPSLIKVNDARSILKRIEEWRTEHPLKCKMPD